MSSKGKLPRKQPAAEQCDITSRDVIRAYLLHRLRYLQTNKLSVVYEDNQKMFDDFLLKDQGLSSQGQTLFCDKLFIILEQNLSDKDWEAIQAAGKMCMKSSEDSTWSAFCKCFRNILEDGQIFWERIAVIMEFLVSIVSQQPLHLMLVNKLAHLFGEEETNDRDETVDKKISASNGWEHVLDKSNRNISVLVVDKNAPTKPKEGSQCSTAVRDTCSCGMEKPITQKKVIKCVGCSQYICMFPQCLHRDSLRRNVGVKHQMLVHSKQKIPNIDSIARCICNEVKNLEHGESFVSCPNPICPHFWCAVGNCGKTCEGIRAMQIHIIGHPDKVVPKKKSQVPDAQTATSASFVEKNT